MSPPRVATAKLGVNGTRATVPPPRVQKASYSPATLFVNGTPATTT